VEEALAVHSRALSIFERAYGRDSPLVSYMLSNHGEILVKLGRGEEAIRAFRRAIELKRRVAADSPDLGYPLTGLGRALLLVGRGAEAVPMLERALSVRERKDPDPERLGETRFALARALVARDQPGDHDEARALAATARRDYAQAPASTERDAALALVDRWRAAEPR
jgi:tetratricopeptide (TPR) repeat protein